MWPYLHVDTLPGDGYRNDIIGNIYLPVVLGEPCERAVLPPPWGLKCQAEKSCRGFCQLIPCDCIAKADLGLLLSCLYFPTAGITDVSHARKNVF